MNIRTISRATTMLVTLALLFCMPAASGQAAPAYGAIVDRAFTDGYGIVAEWSGFNGDMMTFVGVTAVDNTTLNAPQPGGPQKTPSLMVSVLQWNIVTAEVYALFSAETATFSMSVAEDLSSGSVEGTLTAVDDLNQIFNVSIDLVATATSETVDQSCREHYTEPGMLVYNLRSSGQHRDASITGSVIVNGLDLTPGPSTSGHIHYSKTGSISVQVQ